jgi:uncharacterized membrane protein YgcG
MRCPACQQPTTETATACVCGFSLGALDKLLGIPPALSDILSDPLNEFTRGERNRIEREVMRLERAFPQVQFAVVTCEVPENATLALYAFWLFNRGGISAAVERGSQNRLIMLALDPRRSEAVCMIGYGLEPFVGEARLISALHAAHPLLAVDQWGKAVAAFLTELERQLIECAAELNSAYGIGSFEYQGLAHFLDSEESAAVVY